MKLYLSYAKSYMTIMVNRPYILVDEFDKPVNHIISVKGINNWQPDAESTALKITDFLSGCPK